MKFIVFVTGILFIVVTGCKQDNSALYKSGIFSVFPDRVVQGAFEAKAISATHMVSNYLSPANDYQDANISFKFSINGKDNEMLPGTDHQVTIKPDGGVAQTTLIVFGKQHTEPKEENVYLPPSTKWTLQLDMREVQKQFAGVGYYTSAKGDKIFKEDFKAVYVAGNTLPMTWDFDNLKNRPELELKDPDGDGIFETTLVLNNKADVKKIDTVWKLSRDISAFPQYNSPHVLADAIYNMSLEEMEKAVEKDSTLRTGAEWAGVWTRDVSYSIILSMAYMQPKVAMNSLRRKVNARKRIIQDTGTGGAWPVSTDRMIWATAAWEIYLATGDMNWLREAYEVIKLSLQDDYKVAYDPATGLVKGESSFLDWREQTYPKWMEPADIFESLCLGTNAVHYQANMVGAKMAKLLNDNASSAIFETKAADIKNAINTYLWIEEKGYYGQYMYGRLHKMVSPRSEALGEALSVIFDIADTERQQRVVASTPVVDYGIPCIYPQIPGIPPYHNNGIWPFVQTYWLWAGAKAGNEQSVMESIAAIYRPSALFLTNKENFVAENGDFSGTVINSSNMLWSLSGNISLVHKVLFGVRFQDHGLAFEPFVPSALQGLRHLTNFKYRGAILDIEMDGFGNEIKSMTMDGVEVQARYIPEDLTGRHKIKIVLNNSISNPGSINKVKNKFSPAVPFDTLSSVSVNNSPVFHSWTRVPGAEHYKLLFDGKFLAETNQTSFEMPDSIKGPLQIIAVDKDGAESFASEPFGVGKRSILIFEAEQYVPKSLLPYKGFSGDGFVEISQTKNRLVNFEVHVPNEGYYGLSFIYANGNGPINTENKCAIRSLYVGEEHIGAVVFPQRGTNEWSAWGWSNQLMVKLKQGPNLIVLKMEDWNENMNGEINQAMIDCLQVQFIKGN